MKPIVAPTDISNSGDGPRRLPGGRWNVTAQHVSTIHGGERRRGVMPRHAAKLAFGIVISLALANSVSRYYSGHWPMDWGVELSALGPSVETTEKIKAFSLASFLQVEENDQNGGDDAGSENDFEEEVEKKDALTAAAAAAAVADAAAAAPAGVAPPVKRSVIDSQVKTEKSLTRTGVKVDKERVQAEEGSNKVQEEEERKEEKARRKKEEEEEERKEKARRKNEGEEEETANVEKEKTAEEDNKAREETKETGATASAEVQDVPDEDTPDPAEEEESRTLDKHVEEEEDEEKVVVVEEEDEEDDDDDDDGDDDDDDDDDDDEEEEEEEEEEENDSIELQPQPKPVKRPKESDEVKRDHMRGQFAEEKARAFAWPTAKDLLLKPSTDTETGVVVPFQPSKGVIRKAITAQPPLHRPREEVEVEKVLVFLSSSDRGQRVSHLWGHGDKMETVEVILASLVSWCERGFDVTLWFLAAWKVSEEDERIKKALQCERIGTPLAVRYWDDYPPDVGGHLSSKHRLALAEAKDDFDFFISIEDDMHLRPIMLDAFLQNSGRLAKAGEPYLDKFFPGFMRIEHDKLADQQWATWETDAVDYEGIYLGRNAGWWGLVGGNR